MVKKIMPIDTRKTDYVKWSPIWEKSRDAIAGHEHVKDKSTVYLPKLPGQSDEGYEGYLERAQFINFTSRTIQTALGQIFRKPPIISEEDQIKDLLENIDLSGKSITYFSRDIFNEVLSVNRAGILVDYSEEQGRPYAVEYKAENIINWRCANIGGQNKLTLLVLEGLTEVVDAADIYTTKPEKVWKELYLDENGVYTVRDWYKVSDGYMPSDEIKPQINGQYFDYIPFFVATTNGNEYQIIKSPMLDFVNLNYGHYKNDADYENMLHLCGCKTVVAKGWDESNAFPMGGCAVFPTDGDAHFLEAASDSALLEELRHKEEQMAMMGSSLLSGKGRYVAAAETQRLQSEGENATLADVALSVSDVMSKVLRLIAAWNNVSNFEDVSIAYNTDFETSELDPQTLTALMGAVQSGFMSFETYFYNLKNREAYPNGWTEDDEKEAIKESMKEQSEARGGLSTAIPDDSEDNI